MHSPPSHLRSLSHRWRTALRSVAVVAICAILMAAAASKDLRAGAVCDWMGSLERLAAVDSRSMEEAARMVNDGLGSLALVRIQGGSVRPPDTILTLRQVSAYLLLEVAREARLTRSCPCRDEGLTVRAGASQLDGKTGLVQSRIIVAR